jgi:hypothetical protein
MKVKAEIASGFSRGFFPGANQIVSDPGLFFIQTGITPRAVPHVLIHAGGERAGNHHADLGILAIGQPQFIA